MLAIEPEAIQCARAALDGGFEPAVAGRRHVVRALGRSVFNLHLDRLARRRPETEPRARLRARSAQQLCAERQAMRVMMRVRINRTFGHDSSPFDVTFA